MTPLLLASAAVATTLLLAAPLETVDCRPVQGTITARVDDVDLTLRGLRATGTGSSAGDLPDRVTMEALRSMGRSGFELELRIATPDGELTLAGQANAAGSSGSDTRTLDGRLTVRGGTRGFARAAGTLVARGTADTGERRATVQYSGSVCVVGGR